MRTPEEIRELFPNATDEEVQRALERQHQVDQAEVQRLSDEADRQRVADELDQQRLAELQPQPEPEPPAGTDAEVTADVAYSKVLDPQGNVTTATVLDVDGDDNIIGRRIGDVVLEGNTFAFREREPQSSEAMNADEIALLQRRLAQLKEGGG